MSLNHCGALRHGFPSAGITQPSISDDCACSLDYEEKMRAAEQNLMAAEQNLMLEISRKKAEEEALKQEQWKTLISDITEIKDLLKKLLPRY